MQDSYYAIYPESAWYDIKDEDEPVYDYDDNGDPKTTVSATAVPIDLSIQTGGLDEAMTFMYAQCTDGGTNIDFHHLTAIMRFTLKGIEGELVEEIDFSLLNSEQENVPVCGVVDITSDSPTITSEDPTGMISIPTDELGNYTLYLYLPAMEAGSKIVINAYSEDEGLYKKWCDEIEIDEGGIQAGYYYTASRKMDKLDEVPLNHTVSDIEELQAWIGALDTYSGVNMTLTADLDLSEAELNYDLDGDEVNDSNWPYNLTVSGTIDGNGYSISGLKMKSENSVAFLCMIEKGGEVKNLHLKGVDLTGLCAGGIAEYNSGTISGCSVSGELKCTGDGYNSGAIVWQNYGTVIGCYSSASVSWVGAADAGVTVGGIAGENYGMVTACYSTGSLSAPQMGGIIGVNEKNMGTTVEACYWSCAGVNNGIAQEYSTDEPSNEGTTEVDDTTITWADSAEDMNTKLGDWKYVENTDNATKATIPLVLQKNP